MRIISRKTLRAYWAAAPSTRRELEAWFAETKAASWKTPADIKARYASASVLKGGRVVLNICGNKHRLVVWINYRHRIVYIRFLGTHKEYDAIDAESV